MENKQKNNDTQQKASRAAKRKKARITNLIIYSISAILIVFAGVLLVREFVLFPSEPYTTPPPKEGEEAYATPEPLIPLGTPVSDYDMLPVKFYFVDREISCDIYPVGISDGVAEIMPSAKIVSWLSQEPYVVPGDKGNCVISGHNLWKGEAGVFSLLKKMSIGETVAVSFNTGISRYFKVVDMYESAHDDNTPMITRGVSDVRLTLITCKGDWNNSIGQSNTRIVVVCAPFD